MNPTVDVMNNFSRIGLLAALLVLFFLTLQINLWPSGDWTPFIVLALLFFMVRGRGCCGARACAREADSSA